MIRNNKGLQGLVGLEISEVIGLEEDSEVVKIVTADGSVGIFYHEQDCCETVNLNDFEFSGSSFEGAVILSAEEVEGECENLLPEGYYDSFTWTFYKICTTKGELWMRWFGESNGYYSESVDFILLSKQEVSDTGTLKYYG